MAEPVTLDADGDGTLTPTEIFNLLMAESKANGNGSVLGVITGTAIVYRESGGKIRAFRDKTKNPAGGNDRGIWQFNDKYHPDVTDAIAYDPVAATKAAYAKSGGFTHFKPWDGAKVTGAQLSVATKAAKDAGYKVFDTGVGAGVGSYDVTDLPIIGGAIDDAIGIATGGANAVFGAGGKLLGWTEALGRLLSNLLSGDWWKRIGIAVLGIAVLVIGFVLMFKQQVTSAVTSTATGGLIK